MYFNHFHCLTKTISDIPLLCDAVVPKLDIEIENNFYRPVSFFNVSYLCQVSNCGFLFKIVFPFKPTLHIFKDFKSFKIGSVYIF